MTIVFAFVGGLFHEQIASADSERPEEFDGRPAAEYFKSTDGAQLGQRFAVPTHHGVDHYEIRRRTENSRCLYMQAEYVGG